MMAMGVRSRLLLVAAAILCMAPSTEAQERKGCDQRKGRPQDVLPGVEYKLKKSTLGSMCILARLTTDPATNENTFVPAARSYNGNDWESLPGEYSYMTFVCARECLSRVPAAKNAAADKFQLFHFIRGDFSQEDEVSRFLEQATFGPTTELIANWNYTDVAASFADWIKEQTEVVPATEHRDFFRTRALPRASNPISMATTKNPCDEESRWRTYAFTTQDQKTKKVLEIRAVTGATPGGGPYELVVDGQIRTQVNELNMMQGGPLTSGTYALCAVSDGVGNPLGVKVDMDCKAVAGGNPIVDFPNAGSPTDFIEFPSGPSFVDVSHGLPAGSEVAVSTNTLTDTLCDNYPAGGSSDIVYAKDSEGNWYLFDSRLVLSQNTMQDPLTHGGGQESESAGTLCANAPKTFLNEHTCKISNDSSTCVPQKFSDVPVTMDGESLRTFFNDAGRYIYAIGDLAPKESPCMEGPVRWLKLKNQETDCESSITDPSVKNGLADLISEQANDKNRYILETHSKNPISNCHASAIGTKIFVGGTCYRHVHRDFFNIYDFTSWTETPELGGHPGNNPGSNPIKDVAESNEVILAFPSSHNDAGRSWEENKTKMGPPIAKLGDKISFADLPDSVRVEKVASTLGAVKNPTGGSGTIVCGSPGEVTNNGAQLGSGTVPDKQTVWLLTALQSEDQLRQRVAHALSQIFAVRLSFASSMYETEPFLAFYDIFIRNAFGNYRDLLREVIYSPIMGEALAHLDSKSASNFDELYGINGVNPNEHFAREMMQLFTIGTFELRDDGTRDGNSTVGFSETYDNGDVMDAARAWTAFRRQVQRGNILVDGLNRVDPMDIEASWRDSFPKMLLNKHLGDSVPLCVDLPNRAFLRTGATFRLLGSSPHAELHHDDPKFKYTDTVARLVLDTDNSQLYALLCNENAGQCNFLNEVVVETNLKCHGMECDVHTVRVVQVGDFFYEYIRPQCVEMPFFAGKKIKRREPGGVYCAHPRLPLAAEACCELDNDIALRSSDTCKYFGERMTYLSAMHRCALQSRRTCDFGVVHPTQCGQCCNYKSYFWTDSSCSVQVKVNSDGKVGLVQSFLDKQGHPKTAEKGVNEFFRVKWMEGDYTALIDNCDSFKGNMLADGSCVYDTNVSENPVFKSRPVSAEEVRQSCHIGAFDPAVFGDGVYEIFDAFTDEASEIVNIWGKVDGIPFDIDTVFQVKVRGETKYLKNLRSTVSVAAESNTAFSFRNAPQFMNMHEPTLRDAQYETEALIDVYFQHQNVGPFLAKHMIQRFGFSNPSSTYVTSVTKAFTEGIYVWEDVPGAPTRTIGFGTGKYGDLKAMIASILLDREARTPILDVDPTFGSIREPLLKVVHFMRAMEFTAGSNFMVGDMAEKMGQMTYESPNLSGWFGTDFSPAGLLSEFSLLSPEALVANQPNILGLVSGLFSMIKYGFTKCEQGFGPTGGGDCDENLEEGDFSTAVGKLSYTPTSFGSSDDVVFNLSRLLTAGRMKGASFVAVKSAYDARTDGTIESDNMAALRIAQQLVVSAPEFHTTNLLTLEGSREGLPENNAPDQPYKAVVYLFMNGGCDTYNLLVPDHSCSVYAKYKDARKNIALEPEEMKTIDASSSSQVCSKFGVHHKFPVLKELFDSSDALFFANTGVLPEPDVTSDTFTSSYEGLYGLFGHESQVREVQEVDPHEEYPSSGFLGRMADALTKAGFNVGSTSVGGAGQIVYGMEGSVPPADAIHPNGDIPEFNSKPSSGTLETEIRNLNSETGEGSGLFAETWGRMFTRAIDRNSRLSGLFYGVDDTPEYPSTDAGQQFKTVAKLIKTKDARKVERDIIYVQIDGFDTHKHQAQTLEDKFAMMNEAIKTFKTDMEALGLWDKVALYSASEFGRTLTPNSSFGTDHALAGNHFMLGGAVKGGRIKGTYPTNYDDNTVGRGRLIPTTSNEQCLNGLAEWLGVESGDMENVLPNIGAFSNVFSADDLFTAASTASAS